MPRIRYFIMESKHEFQVAAHYIFLDLTLVESHPGFICQLEILLLVDYHCPGISGRESTSNMLGPLVYPSHHAILNNIA